MIRLITKIIVIGGTLLIGTYIFTKRKRVNPVLLNELADRYSSGSDEIIKTEIQRGVLTFISGKLTFDYKAESRMIGVKSEFFFQNLGGEWVKKMHEEQLSHRVLTKESLAEIKELQTVVFEIEAPKQTFQSAVQ